MSQRVIRNTLIGLELFTGVMALYGGIRLLADATGFGVKEEWLRGSPFTNYQIPAIGLLVGVGGSSLLAAAALMRGRRSLGWLLSVGAGAILMVFEIVETLSFGLRSFQQPLMLVIGSLIAGLGVVFGRDEGQRGPKKSIGLSIRGGVTVRH